VKKERVGVVGSRMGAEEDEDFKSVFMGVLRKN
jgi:hypothetical protein